MIDSVVDLVEEHVDLGGSHFFWINCRTLVLYACFTTECGSPGIWKSMSTSFTIIDSRLSSWSAMDFSILLRSSSSSTLNVLLSWEKRNQELSFASAVLRVATGRTVPSWDQRVWITTVSTGRPVLSEELSSSQKELTSISWERDVFLPSCMSSIRPDLSRIGFGVGWKDWKNFVCWTTSSSGSITSRSGCRATSEPNSLYHSCFNEIFDGGWGDMYTSSYKTSPVFNLTAFGIQ